MAEVSALKALTDYFQDPSQGSSLSSESTTGGIPGRRPATDWRKEMLALTKEDRTELAQMVCAVTGDTLATK